MSDSEVQRLSQENQRLAAEVARLREENHNLWCAYELASGCPYQYLGAAADERWFREYAYYSSLLRDEHERRIAEGVSLYSEERQWLAERDAEDKERRERQRTAGADLRRQVFERDGNACVACGATDNLVCDHVIPWSKDGRTVLDNMQTLCRRCNGEKGDLMPDEWAAKLLARTAVIALN